MVVGTWFKRISTDVIFIVFPVADTLTADYLYSHEIPWKPIVHFRRCWQPVWYRLPHARINCTVETHAEYRAHNIIFIQSDARKERKRTATDSLKRTNNWKRTLADAQDVKWLPLRRIFVFHEGFKFLSAQWSVGTAQRKYTRTHTHTHVRVLYTTSFHSPIRYLTFAIKAFLNNWRSPQLPLLTISFS